MKFEKIVCRGCAKGANEKFGPVKAWACIDLSRQTGLCVECAELGDWNMEHVATYDRALYLAAEGMAANMASEIGPGVRGIVLR